MMKLLVPWNHNCLEAFFVDNAGWIRNSPIVSVACNGRVFDPTSYPTTYLQPPTVFKLFPFRRKGMRDESDVFLSIATVNG